MKPKVSPTSPKATSEGESAIEKYYQENMSTIERPRPDRLRGRVLVLLLATLFGFAAGVLAQLVLLSYGPDIPWLDRLMTVPGSATVTLLGAGRRQATPTADQLTSAVVSAVSPSVAQLFVQKKDAVDLSAVYVPGESLGNVLVLTEDGYVATTQQAVGDREGPFVVVLDGVVYPVEATVLDPLTRVSFLKIKARNLSATSLQSGSIPPGVVLVKRYGFGFDPSAFPSTLVPVTVGTTDTLSQLVTLSESVPVEYSCGVSVPVSFNQSIVFSFSGEAVGVCTVDQDGSRLVPFSDIAAILDQLLATQTVARPYLGVRYIDLTTAVNVPSQLSHNVANGALITSDDETKHPSIAPKSPAQRAGVQAKDIVTAVDGKSLNENFSLRQSVAAGKPGQLLTLSILRGTTTKEIKVTLDELK
ncbi:MAG: S1C family serine protease [Patescibacteria group bacterium]